MHPLIACCTKCTPSVYSSRKKLRMVRICGVRIRGLLVLGRGATMVPAPAAPPAAPPSARPRPRHRPKLQDAPPTISMTGSLS